jgi:hypothetical protein
MSYHFANEDGVLRIRLSGCININDLSQGLAEIEKLEDSFEITPNRIVDLTQVTDVDLPFETVKQLAARRKAKVFKNPVKTAVIAPRAVHIGFASMLQSLIPHPQMEVRVFRNAPDAIAWIAQNTKTPPE